MNDSGFRSRVSFQDDAIVDVRRYLGALKRNRLLIALIVIAITGLVLALSLILPKKYEATAKIVLNADTSLFTSPDAASTQRELSTIQKLLSSPSVEEAAANELDSGETKDSIASKIDSSVDQTANLINVSATDEDPERAAAIANAVAGTFLDTQRQLERERLDAAAASIEEAIAALQGTPDAGAQVAALQQRLSDLRVQKASAGSDLQLAETAEVPTSPSSPRPVRNTILAFFASLFIAILVALARDQLRPGVSDPREVSQLLGVNTLAGIPYVGRGLRRNQDVMSAIEHESYETLRASIQLALPAERQQVILITSAVHAEGKTTVSARLGRLLAEAGHRTLLISGDLRWPELHELFGLPQRPGFTEVLQLIERAGVSDQLLPATAHAVRVRGSDAESSNLHVLTSGTLIPDPARILSSEAAHKFFRYVRSFNYRYIIVDAPPLLGIADVQGLMPEVDQVLVVARLDRLTVDKVVETREVLHRSKVDLLGVVVIGARADVSPYYLTDRTPTFTAPPSTRQSKAHLD
jgi:capsular exopolysaccharide synthesis family protein